MCFLYCTILQHFFPIFPTSRPLGILSPTQPFSASCVHLTPHYPQVPTPVPPGIISFTYVVFTPYQETMFGPPSLDSFSEICLWIAFFKSCTVAFCITTTAENNNTQLRHLSAVNFVSSRSLFLSVCSVNALTSSSFCEPKRIQTRKLTLGLV